MTTSFFRKFAGESYPVMSVCMSDNVAKKGFSLWRKHLGAEWPVANWRINQISEKINVHHTHWFAKPVKDIWSNIILVTMCNYDLHLYSQCHKICRIQVTQSQYRYIEKSWNKSLIFEASLFVGRQLGVKPVKFYSDWCHINVIH